MADNDDEPSERAIYRAIRSKSNNDEQIRELCSKNKEGPLLICTLNRSTVLHVACYYEKFELADKLFSDMLKEKDNLLSWLPTRTNVWGETVLLHISTSDKGLKFAKMLLEKVPALLPVLNDWGESCVFQAVRYGQREMFKFLTDEVHKVCLKKEFDHLYFFQNKYNTTILHLAILTKNFDIALMIATKFPDLCDKRDNVYEMTALQMLACSPTAFKSGAKLGFITELVYSIVSTEEEDTNGEVGRIRKAINFILGCNGCCIFPMVEEVREMKKSNQDTLKLAKILIKKDTSWEITYKPIAELTPNIPLPRPRPPNTAIAGKDIAITDDMTKARNEIVVEKDIEEGHSNKLPKEEPALFLAARKGCIEIVKEILDVYPQAVDCVNDDLENLVHVAIKSGNLDVLEYLEQKTTLLRFLKRTVDNKLNTILHKIGYPATPNEVSEDTKMKSPVMQLSEELLLLERLENMCPSYLVNHQNIDKMTARQEFAMRKENLRTEAKDFLKRTAEHCTVVIILIATVAFAAAYTVPGGPDERTGLPVLLGQPLFLVFTISDVLSLGFALTAVVIFLSILTSPFRLTDFRRSLPQKLLLGFTFLFLSVSMMMIAFAATIILTINTKQRWTKIALYIASFFPIFMFMLSYVPFYKELLHLLKYWVIRIGKSLPRPARSLEIV